MFFHFHHHRSDFSFRIDFVLLSYKYSKFLICKSCEENTFDNEKIYKYLRFSESLRKCHLSLCKDRVTMSRGSCHSGSYSSGSKPSQAVPNLHLLDTQGSRSTSTNVFCQVDRLGLPLGTHQSKVEGRGEALSQARGPASFISVACLELDVRVLP